MEARKMYEKWLKDFADDAELVAELKGLEGNDKEIEDRFYKGLEFGTAGMRGVIAYGTNRMNVYNVRRATQGLAQFIGKVEGGAQRGVAIAYDSRKFSKEFAQEAALVLLSQRRQGLSLRESAPRSGAVLYCPPAELHRGHCHHRQP